MHNRDSAVTTKVRHIQRKQVTHLAYTRGRHEASVMYLNTQNFLL